MPLQVLPLTTADIPEFAEVDDTAMQTWPLARAVQCAAPPGQTRKSMISGWLKVIDEECDGELIAGGCWKFVETPEAKKDVKKDSPAPVAEARGPMEEKKVGPGTNCV